MNHRAREHKRGAGAQAATEPQRAAATTLKRTLGFIVAVTLTLVLAACGQEARSETDVPAHRVVPELTEHLEPSAPEAPMDAEALWAEDGFPVHVEADVDEPLADVQASRGLRSSDRRPALVATDQGGGQITDPEPADGIGRSSQPYEPVSDPVDRTPAEANEGIAEAPEPAVFVAAGQEVVFTVESELGTEHSQPGDVFYAYLVDDLVAADGMVLLPRGLRARGRVVDVRKSENSDEMPILELSIDELIGERDDTPIVATVVHAELEADARDSDSESVVKVLTGAAAGAILGRILGGDDKDAVKGGVAGAAAGAAVAYGTRGGHAKLPAGGLVTIRLEQPLTVF